MNIIGVHETNGEHTYYSISEKDPNEISKIIGQLPSHFTNSFKKRITILNFEAFDSDPNNSQNILRSDYTECHSNIGISSNYNNQFICLSWRGFCGYLYYDVSALRPNVLIFERKKSNISCCKTFLCCNTIIVGNFFKINGPLC